MLQQALLSFPDFADVLWSSVQILHLLSAPPSYLLSIPHLPLESSLHSLKLLLLPQHKKKTGLDPNDNNNLHPIPNLPFSFGDSDMKRKNSFHVIVAKNEVIRLANHQHGDWKVTD